MTHLDWWALAFNAAIFLGGLGWGIWLGQRRERLKRRASMGLPPPQERGLGILAIVPQMERTCIKCGKTYKCHPVVADKRCPPCYAEDIDEAEDRWLEEQKAKGW